MDRLPARQHWIALDAAFSRALSPAEIDRARQLFTEHLDAVSDVCFQLWPEDTPAELRQTPAALKAVLGSAWERAKYR
jgi:hypothetical protein